MKKYWKTIVVFLFLVTGTIFLFLFFRQEKTVTIEGENLIVENAEQGVQTSIIEKEPEANGEEESFVSPSETVENQEIIKKEESVDENKDEEKSSAKTGLISWGYSSGRNSKVDTIIVHSVYNKTGGDQYSLNKILDIFKDYGVAAHYIIERDGDVHQLVAEKNTAYHAGTGQVPDGRSGVNDFSVGIEVINSENDNPTKAQYKSLDDLVDEIKKRYKITYILGHSDIAPGRKTDPWNFDWDKIGGKKD